MLLAKFLTVVSVGLSIGLNPIGLYFSVQACQSQVDKVSFSEVPRIKDFMRKRNVLVQPFSKYDNTDKKGGIKKIGSRNIRRIKIRMPKYGYFY